MPTLQYWQYLVEVESFTMEQKEEREFCLSFLIGLQQGPPPPPPSTSSSIMQESIWNYCNPLPPFLTHRARMGGGVKRNGRGWKGERDGSGIVLLLLPPPPPPPSNPLG